MKAILKGGKKWEEIPISHGGGKKWASACHNYEIFLTRDGKYRLVAFEHDPSPQFPQAEFWMREFDTLNLAAHQAEVM
jgi:hypothetical protein